MKEKVFFTEEEKNYIIGNLEDYLDEIANDFFIYNIRGLAKNFAYDILSRCTIFEEIKKIIAEQNNIDYE